MRTGGPGPGRPDACAVGTTVTVPRVRRRPVMAEPWSEQSLQALPATVLGALGALGSEFLREWEAQDMRVTLFNAAGWCSSPEHPAGVGVLQEYGDRAVSPPGGLPQFRGPATPPPP